RAHAGSSRRCWAPVVRHPFKLAESRIWRLNQMRPRTGFGALLIRYRRRIQLRPPVLLAVLEECRDQQRIVVGDFLDDLVAERRVAVRIPGGLHRLVAMEAGAEREPFPVL